MYFDIDGNEITFEEAAPWFGKPERIIGRDSVRDADVSTVFLVIDHSHGLGGAPILFETMIFGGEHSGWQYRYATKEEAALGHAKVVSLLRQEGGLLGRILEIYS